MTPAQARRLQDAALRKVFHQQTGLDALTNGQAYEEWVDVPNAPPIYPLAVLTEAEVLEALGGDFQKLESKSFASEFPPRRRMGRIHH